MRHKNPRKIKFALLDASHPLRLKLLLLAFGVAPMVLLLLVACGQQKEENKTALLPVVQAQEPPNTYLGNAACKDCHPSEFKLHRGTHHDLALRLMDRQNLGKQSPPTGFIPSTNYMMLAQDEGFQFGQAGGQVHPLQLAFGSGKSGMAFTTIASADTMAEARISYFPPQKKWYITPGQESLPETSLGNVMRDKAARQCLGCHVITLPTEALMPEQKFMGVGCEACHGPGGLHVEAVQKKDTTHLHMDKLGTLGGVRTNDLCGRCHRTEQDVVSKNLNQKHTDLFQAHGLAQSRCFRESGDKLTCITCHDPHTNVNENHKTYIPACLKCHAGPEANSSQRLAQAKICPVNPKDNCIQCHMPKRSEPVFPGSPRRVADHFIRAYRAGANPLDTRTMQSSQPPKASAPNLR